MTLSSPIVIGIALLAPFTLLIVVASVMGYRKRSALEATEALILRRRAGGEIVERPPIFFEAEPKTFLLGRHFTLPQRTYLRQQIRPAGSVFIICAYVLLVAASLGLLPDRVAAFSASTHAQQVWRSYSNTLTASVYLAVIFAILTSLIVVASLQTPPVGPFMRTRPLSLRFLFWGRTLIALSGLLGGIMTAFLGSNLLLVLCYGPVRKQVAVSLQSLLWLDLSMLATVALVFSLMVLFSCLPKRATTGRMKYTAVLLGALVGSQVVHFFRLLSATPATRLLFFSSMQSSTGSLFPTLFRVVCVVALLAFAQRLSTRFEL